MPAGRPRKYFTDEDRAEAHRRASYKYYHTNRDQIGLDRKLVREKARTEHKSSASKAAPKLGRPDACIPKETPELPASDLLKIQVLDLENKVNHVLCDRPVGAVLASFCLNFETRVESGSGDPVDAFTEPLMLLLTIEDTARTYAKELRRKGSPEEEAIERLLTVACRSLEVTHQLEDLVCEASMGPQSFIEDFRRGELQFQRKRYSVTS